MAKYLASDNDPQDDMTQSKPENGVSVTDCTSVCIFGHLTAKVDHIFWGNEPVQNDIISLKYVYAKH